MKFILKAAIPALLLLSSGAGAFADEASDKAAIRDVLASYEKALNAADTAAIVDLYTADGVQMAPDFPAAVGSKAVAASYDGTFKAIALKLAFTIDEVKLLGPDAALLRSHSNGTVKVNGSDQPAAPAAFKELFLLARQNGEEWKFTHYSFSAAQASGQ
ncbi:SgcJ/EcaC family oxidoreductase [uncultured Cohaesibacter sp.]|uniref:YybH family protein n=1 Tax=uncultured Cohaesibacter sp. TaxID=1002546 RepID=UPI00292E09E4|nr:SgcJ/EcaC family oxidoreductase [uncultured Cohaesibacter sp.]